MKILFKLVIISISITSCSNENLSKKDKAEIAIITCNIMAETKQINSAQVIKELNIAREKIGQDRFLGNSKDIATSFELNLCTELVLNSDGEYKRILQKETERLETQENILRTKRNNELYYQERRNIVGKNNATIRIQIKNLETYLAGANEYSLYITEDREKIDKAKAELNILLEDMKRFASRPEPVLIFTYDPYYTDKENFDNYTQLQKELIQDYFKKEKSISLLKDLSIIPDYYANKVNTIFKKREQGTLDYDSYEDFCYLFSDKNQNNISFSKTKIPSKTYLNPLHWEYIFDSKKEKKIEAICTVDLNELRNLFIKNNQRDERKS